MALLPEGVKPRFGDWSQMWGQQETQVTLGSRRDSGNSRFTDNPNPALS